MSKTDTPKAAKPAQAPQKIQYSQHIQFESHSFRLSNEMVQRYDHVEKDVRAKPHGHIFHTKDAAGRDQTQSNSVGGHFHEITMVDNGPGMVPTLKCGPPMRMVKQRKGKTFANVKVPYLPREQGVDNHTHSFEYLGTQKMTPRHSNIEAAKTHELLAGSKEKPIPGIVPGGDTGRTDAPPAE